MNNGEDFRSTFPHFSTLAIHAGQDPTQWSRGEVIPPISLSTTYQQFAPGKHRGYEYSRSGNPTRNCTETCIAALEDAKYCFLFSSGLAGTTTITNLLNAGDHIIAMDDVYGGTNRYFSKVINHFNISTTFIDATEPKLINDAIQPNTRLIWIETPTNPLLKLVDIKAISSIAHVHENILVVVDNTFMSPYFQRPLELGADISFHSCTKYMNGHSDAVIGCVILNDEILAEKIKFLQNSLGAVPSPFDCYLLNRGVKTLSLRMQCHMRNGLAVANWLQQDPRVSNVRHPGLKSHPQYELGKEQMRGYSGMVSFCINGGLEEAKIFLSAIKIFTLAESLGGFESLADHPAIMTHASVPPEQRRKLGISDSLIRLSVGLEDIEDIIEDLDLALKEALPNMERHKIA